MRVVVADNDEGALELVALDLRLEGHDVVAAAADGAAAVAVCRVERPDVLVVDYRMPPGLDGVEVARAVLGEGSAGAVLVHSNYQDPAVVERAEALGAVWVPKGDLARLRRAISAHGPRSSGGG